MTPEPNEDELVRYLLARMPEDERETFERRYFAEDELFERLLAAEAELADAFVRGELPAGDRAAFESRLRASSVLREREKFARALRRRMEAGAPVRERRVFRRAWTYAAAAALCLGAGLFAVEAVRLRAERERLTATRARLEVEAARLDREAAARDARLDALSRQLEELKGAANPRVPVFPLAPGLYRGSGASNRITPPEGVAAVDLEVSLDGPPYPAYAATLRRAAGEVVARGTGLRSVQGPAGETVSLRVERSRLSPGDYVLTVEGVRAGRPPEAVADLVLTVPRTK